MHELGLICACGHNADDHVRVVILSGPGNKNESVPVRESHRCSLCLCRDFQAQETEPVSNLDIGEGVT